MEDMMVKDWIRSLPPSRHDREEIKECLRKAFPPCEARFFAGLVQALDGRGSQEATG